MPPTRTRGKLSGSRQTNRKRSRRRSSARSARQGASRACWGCLCRRAQSSCITHAARCRHRICRAHPTPPERRSYMPRLRAACYAVALSAPQRRRRRYLYLCGIPQCPRPSGLESAMRLSRQLFLLRTLGPVSRPVLSRGPEERIVIISTILPQCFRASSPRTALHACPAIHGPCRRLRPSAAAGRARCASLVIIIKSQLTASTGLPWAATAGRRRAARARGRPLAPPRAT